MLFPLLIISSGRKTSVRCHLLWSEVIAVPGDLSLRHLQMLRQGPPSCHHPLKYAAACSYLCPGSIVAFDPLSEEKADHCRAAPMPALGARGSRAREGGSGVRAPARPLQAPGSGRERRLGLAALSIPVLCFASKGKLLSLGPSASRRKLPSSQSRCLGLSLVRGFMALHLYLRGGKH